MLKPVENVCINTVEILTYNNTIFCTFNLVRIYLQWRLENHYKKYSKEQLSKDLQSYFKSVASTTENYQNGKAVSL